MNWLLNKLMPRLRRHLGLSLCRVMARELVPLPADAGDAGIEYRQMARREMLDWSADPELELKSEWVRAAMARGNVCLGALHEGRLVGYMWLAYSATPYTDDIWVRVGPDGRYTYKIFVRSAWRHRGIAQGLYRNADAPAFVKDRTRAALVAELDNRASIAAAQRSGFRTKGYAGFVQRLRAKLVFHTPGVRRAGIAFYDAVPARAARVGLSTIVGVLAGFALACLSGPPLFAGEHSLDLAWEGACGLIALAGFALRFLAAGTAVRYPSYFANAIILAGVLIDIRSPWLLAAAAALYLVALRPLPAPRRLIGQLREGAFSLRRAIGAEYQTLFAIVAVFTAIEVGHDYSVLGRLELDPVWQVVLAINIALFAVLRFCQKFTRLLSPERG